jgi:hypothetical protein
MKDYMNDLQTRINALNNQRVYVDEFDGGVWMSMHHEHGSSNVAFDKDQAKDLIAALIRIVDIDRKDVLVLAREALSHTATDLHHENFVAEEQALVAIDFALEKM